MATRKPREPKNWTGDLSPETISLMGGVQGFRPSNFTAPVGSENFHSAVSRVTNFALSLPDHIVSGGLQWYDAVNDATTRQSRDLGISPVHGAGIVAAVSPNMDFDKRNISALDELPGINEEHWNLIHASANQPKRWNEENQRYQAAPRLPEVGAMMREVAPSLSAATDRNLLDARSIYRGAHPNEVFNPRGGPKRHRFYQNIANPDDPIPVTIDGRQADIIANSYRPWNWSGRGISSADLKSGKSTRYMDHEEVMRQAARAVSQMDHPRMAGINAARLQAVTWMGGKLHERAWPTVSGLERSQGVRRIGQRYTEAPRSGWNANR